MTKGELKRLLIELFETYLNNMETNHVHYDNSYNNNKSVIKFYIDSFDYSIAYPLYVTFINSNNFVEVYNGLKIFRSDDYHKVYNFCKEYFTNY